MACVTSCDRVLRGGGGVAVGGSGRHARRCSTDREERGGRSGHWNRSTCSVNIHRSARMMNQNRSWHGRAMVCLTVCDQPPPMEPGTPWPALLLAAVAGPRCSPCMDESRPTRGRFSVAEASLGPCPGGGRGGPDPLLPLSGGTELPPGASILEQCQTTCTAPDMQGEQPGALLRSGGGCGRLWPH